MKELLSTGEFAKLCHVNKKTLFYYEKIGILEPYTVTQQGYRYYALHQLDTMSTIKMFQKIGMSLHDIQDFFDSKDIYFKQEQLNQQIETVKQTIQEYQNIYSTLQFINEQYTHLKEIGLNHLFIETIDNQYYHIQPKDQNHPTILNSLQYGLEFGVLIYPQDKPHTFQYTFQKTTPEKSNFIKPKGRYASIYKLVDSHQLMDIIDPFLKMLSQYSLTYPIYHEDFCNDIIHLKDKIIIKLSIQINSDEKTI